MTSQADDRHEQAGPLSDEPSGGGYDPSFLIVAVGASAGGLEAYRSFFEHMPEDSGMAFVLVQHLAPDAHSMLAALVGRTTRMVVSVAADGEPVCPNRVYVIPPDATLTVLDGVLQVHTPAPPRQHRWPIDTFFCSLAEDQGEKLVQYARSAAIPAIRPVPTRSRACGENSTMSSA